MTKLEWFDMEGWIEKQIDILIEESIWYNL